METEWKKSRYAFFIEQENGEMIIYHSTTGFILQCTEPEYIEKTKKIANQSAIEMDEENDLIAIVNALAMPAAASATVIAADSLSRQVDFFEDLCLP